MSRKPSKRVTFFTPNYSTENPTAVFLKHSTFDSCRVAAGAGNRKGVGASEAVVGIFSFRMHHRRVRIFRVSPPCRFFRRLGAKLARALRFVSLRTRRRRRKMSKSPPVRLSASEDSQRIEAIEDCIEFLNSSSSWCCGDSLSRSSSATGEILVSQSIVSVNGLVTYRLLSGKLLHKKLLQ